MLLPHLSPTAYTEKHRRYAWVARCRMAGNQQRGNPSDGILKNVGHPDSLSVQKTTTIRIDACVARCTRRLRRACGALEQIRLPINELQMQEKPIRTCV